MSDAIPSEGPQWPENDQAPAFMDFEKPKKRRKKKSKKPGPKPASEEVTRVPAREILKLASGGVSARARAATNLRLEGASYAEIADVLEFETALDAKAEVERTLAKTHSAEDWDSLRLVTAARALELFKNSMAMARAEFLEVEDEDGNVKKVPNRDRIHWHKVAGIDLMNHATITGAKAPTKIEVTPDEEKLDIIVSKMLAYMGEAPPMDAEVLELEVMPEAPSDPEEL